MKKGTSANQQLVNIYMQKIFNDMTYLLSDTVNELEEKFNFELENFESSLIKMKNGKHLKLTMEIIE